LLTIEKAFGQVLRKIRKDKHINQEKLAIDSDLDRSFISQLEHGRKQPSLTTIFQLSKALDISPSKMISSVEKIVGEKQ
jgi:transcriptional regulator with XRE-family HTH domain